MVHAGERGIPTDELEIAADIYIGLQGFFRKHKDLRERPLFITGESYGGKYVPAIGVTVLSTLHALLSLLGAHCTQRLAGSPIFEARLRLHSGYLSWSMSLGSLSLRTVSLSHVDMGRAIHASSAASVSTAAHAGHFILEMEAAHGESMDGQPELQERRQLPKRARDLGPPLFKLTGLAIGNGLTDPATQARHSSHVSVEKYRTKTTSAHPSAQW